MAQFREKPMYKRQGNNAAIINHFACGNTSRMEGGNLMTENNILYSYDEPVVCFVEHPNKQVLRRTNPYRSDLVADVECIFITSNDFSNTTNRHVSQARYALLSGEEKAVVLVPEVDAEYTSTNAEYVRTNYLEALDALLSLKKIPNARLDGRLTKYHHAAQDYVNYLVYANGVPSNVINLLHSWDSLFDSHPKLFGYIAASAPHTSSALQQFIAASNLALWIIDNSEFVMKGE